MFKLFTCILLTATLFCTRASSQEADSSRINAKNPFADNKLIPKGGTGVILSRTLYVDLRSPNNELRLPNGETWKTWTGKIAPAVELVIFFQDRVLSPQALPEGFDLSKAIVVSFENDRVRFFDFGKMSGGYFMRPERK